ncbi:MAG: hypothetical protein V4773_19155 [Verrucomicrobiota bacterium]
MRWLPEGRVFGGQLQVWGVRGVICAFPNLFWATCGGFATRQGFAAMIAGIVTWVLAFAWITSLPSYVQGAAINGFGKALSLVANIRVAFSVLSLGYVDMLSGGVVVEWLAELSKKKYVNGQSTTATFGWTYLATLMQGGAIVATILFFAGFIWGCQPAPARK